MHCVVGLSMCVRVERLVSDEMREIEKRTLKNIKKERKTIIFIVIKGGGGQLGLFASCNLQSKPLAIIHNHRGGALEGWPRGSR